jgi:hypothetical protein
MNSSYGVDECAAICTAATVLSLANLTGCMLTFTGTTPGVWYALAIQVNNILVYLFYICKNVTRFP